MDPDIPGTGAITLVDGGLRVLAQDPGTPADLGVESDGVRCLQPLNHVSLTGRLSAALRNSCGSSAPNKNTGFSVRCFQRKGKEGTNVDRFLQDFQYTGLLRISPKLNCHSHVVICAPSSAQELCTRGCHLLLLTVVYCCSLQSITKTMRGQG